MESVAVEFSLVDVSRRSKEVLILETGICSLPAESRQDPINLQGFSRLTNRTVAIPKPMWIPGICCVLPSFGMIVSPMLEHECAD